MPKAICFNPGTNGGKDMTTANPVSDISEKIAAALRNNDLENIADDSPYIACLFPLLRALGWKNVVRELIEALPHFAKTIDLVDLRNILVEIGYESSPMVTRMGQVRPELYPCLFVTDTGELFVLLERQGGMVEYFDGQRKQTLQNKAASLNFPGTAYLITDKHNELLNKNTQDNWFQLLASRFRKLIIHLFGMTFIINLVALFVPLVIMLIYDKVIGAKSIEALPMIVSGAALLIVADLVMRYFRANLLGRVAGRMDYLIGVETFKKILYMPPLNIEQSSIHTQLSLLKQFDAVRDFFTGQTVSIVLELPFVLLFLGVIAILAGPVAFIPVAMMAVYVVAGIMLIPRINRKVIRAGLGRTTKQRMIMQSLAGRKEINAIGGEDVWRQRFREISGDAVMANYETFILNTLMNNFAQAIMSLGALAVLSLGTLQVIEGSMTIGALIATMALVWRVLAPLQSIFLAISRLQQTIKSMRQINQLMKLPEERTTASTGLVLPEIEGHIWLNSISFRYGAQQNPALLGVSLSIEPGELVAIVGHTGSGKSTLLKMIAGMYVPQGGTIMIDGLDLRQLNIIELRRKIAYVPQQTQVFHGTIAQNMRLADGLATDEDLRSAAEKAGILTDILALPEGFDTRLTDNASEHYPPGFLRALSIARALVSNSRIILFDEPGASLDYPSDQRFIQQLKGLKRRRTVVMVSHRPSHIRLADKVILLERGMVKYIGEPEKAISILMQG
jgi:ATP-binding cassette subfamily C protein/ATP-binding cassette subfamily C protein LapB